VGEKSTTVAVKADWLIFRVDVGSVTVAVWVGGGCVKVVVGRSVEGWTVNFIFVAGADVGGASVGEIGVSLIRVGTV
jgi:hypothetical protein